MLRDERITQARRRIMAAGFGLWYVLLLGMLYYRQFYLGQPWGEYWDIVVVFVIGNLYVTIASFSQGAVHQNSIVRCAKWMLPSCALVIVAVMYWRGAISTVTELLTAITAALLGLSMVGLLAYGLYRRWERRNDLAE